MKESLSRFYDYLDSEEELGYFVRLNAEWNEESFCKMKKLVRAVMADYAHEDLYPKRFVGYFMNDIDAIINMLSHFKVCTEENIKQGYTQETYMSMISDKKKQINELMWEFRKTLHHPSDYEVLGVTFETER